MALGAALALVLPVSALATFLGAPDADVRQLVAGPAPSTAPAGEVAADSPVAGPGQPALSEVPAATTTTTTEAPLRVDAVHDRTQPPTGGTGGAADDPVVRAPTTTALAAIATRSLASPPPPTTIPPKTCVAEEFKLAVSVEKSAYKPGDKVSGSSVLEKLTPGTCLLPSWWVESALLNSGGVDVSFKARGFGSSLNSDQQDKWGESCGAPCPRPVDRGAVLTQTFYWETSDCTTPPPGPVIPVPAECIPFPAGSYSVIATWSGPDSGPPARTTFQLGG
jgi:hypothetical protein